MFPNPSFIHLIRNGNDVISSTVKRGWYTDFYLNSEIIDWVEMRAKNYQCNLPWYLDDESKKFFPKWNQITRAACVWRTLTETGIKYSKANKNDCLEIKYEKLLESPEIFADLFKKNYGLKLTKITERHINSIKKHKATKHSQIYEQIENPAYDKYMTLMEELNYFS